MDKKNPLPPRFKVPGQDSIRDYSLAEVLAKLGQLDGKSFDKLKTGEDARILKDREEARKRFDNRKDRKKYLHEQQHARVRKYLSSLGAPKSIIKKVVCGKIEDNYINVLEDLVLGLARPGESIAPRNKQLEAKMVKDIHAERIIQELQNKKQDVVKESSKREKHKVTLTGKEDYRNIQTVRDPIIKLAMFKALKEDIVFFVRKVLGAEPTPQQCELFRAYQKDNARISVRSAHGTGKSTSLSWIILHSLLFVPNVRILCTAPSAPQMYDVLWAELKMWRSRMQVSWWKDQVRITQTRAEFVAGTKTIGGERTIDNANRFATARTARKDNPVALQGMHSESGQMVIIGDESSGIPNEVFETASGTLTGKNTKVVLMSNPTTSDPENFFYKTQTKNRENWNCLHFSALDSPLVTKRWVQEIIDEYGEDSPIYEFRVLGNFPTISDDILIPIHLVETAWGREIDTTGSERICGVDPARFGEDRTAMVIRKGGEVIYMDQWAKYDTMYSAGKIFDAYQEGLFDIACVDVIGLGAGIADRLGELMGRDKVIDVNVAERPAAREKFSRLRDELWWKCREFFEKRTCSFSPKVNKILYEAILAELCTIKYSYVHAKRKIQSKDEIKKDGKKSPNLADGLCLTFIKEVSGEGAQANQFTGKARPIVAAPSGAVVG